MITMPIIVIMIAQTGTGRLISISIILKAQMDKIIKVSYHPTLIWHRCRKEELMDHLGIQNTS